MADIQKDLQILKNKAKKEITAVQNLKDLDDIFRSYFGKKGELTRILRSLSSLDGKLRITNGKKANKVRDTLQKEFEKRAEKLRSEEIKKIEEKEWLDVTAPGKTIVKGSLHPLTHTQRKAQDIFASMGFIVAYGPEIETEWYNFDALNIEKDHPARDMWDTFWIKRQNPGSERFVLRTHTSPVQIRYMESHQPPLRIIAPGRVFRYEATDARHEFDLMQLEGLMVGADISAAHFKAVIQEFYRKFFAKPVIIRLRPSYFPFVEPGFEVDMSCLMCEGKGFTLSKSTGCSSCGQTGWLEMMGAGMVHPKIFKGVGYKKGDWQGFAFGMGLDRLAMMKYRINDVRLFRGGDVTFLKQF